jgi:hypothetical protein
MIGRPLLLADNRVNDRFGSNSALRLSKPHDRFTPMTGHF